MTVEDGNGPVDLGNPKQRAVLALLLIHANQPLTPDRLMESLWDGAPPRSGAATLQAYISKLRRALEPDRTARAPGGILAMNGGGYQLNVAETDLDSSRFEASVHAAGALVAEAPERARALLDESLKLWRGPALADFAYADFAQATIARLEDLRTTARELLVSADLELGRHADLIPEIEELLTEHPLREGLWSHLMIALYRAGRQADALAAYRRFEARLGDDLGLLPSERLRALERAILQQDPALAAPSRPTATAVSVVDRLVGRASERDRFREVLARARAGHGSALVIEGEAGIGKSRLLETLQRDAEAAGFRTVFTRCVEIGGAPPYWPWTQLARQVDPEVLKQAAGAYAPYLAAFLPDIDRAGSTPSAPLFRIAEAVTSALRTLAGYRPTVLAIDDVYAADPDSLSLLTLVAAELPTLPLVLLITTRGQALGPAHPVTDTLAELNRLAWVGRMPLHRFDREEVGELVRGLTDAEVDAATIEAIHERASGNAFYTVELTRLLESEGCLVADAAATAVPGTVIEVLDRRLGALGEDALRLVRAAAVHGREFDLALISEALEVDVDTASEATEELRRAGFVLETDRPGHYRFTHVLLVDGIADALGSLRRADLHHRLAEALERRATNDPGTLASIAHHRVAGMAVTGPAPALEALSRAGEHAVLSNALESAEALFERRLAIVEGEPPSVDRARWEIDALFDLARVWTWREGYHSPRLGTAANRVAEIVAGTRDISVLMDRPASAAHPVLGTLQASFSVAIVSGNVADAARLTGQLRDLADRHGDPLFHMTAQMCTTITCVHTGEPARAIAAGNRTIAALQVLDPTGNVPIMLPLDQQSARVSHHAFVAWAYHLSGDRRRAWRELDQARAWSERIDHTFTTAFCVSIESIVGMMDDNPTRVADALGWGNHEVGLFALLEAWRELAGAWVRGREGRDPRGEAGTMRDVIAALESAGARVVHSLWWAGVAQLEEQAGARDDALEAAERGLEFAQRSGERFWYPELQRRRGLLLAAMGRNDESQDALLRARAARRIMGLRPVELPLPTPAGGG